MKIKFSSLAQISIFLGFLSALLVAILLTRTPQDADMWWHLRAGQVMWQTKSILLIDNFSYTRSGQPWVNAFWISELILYLTFKSGGYFGLACLIGLTGGATFSILYRRMNGNGFINAFIVILASITAAPVWGPRPQIFSFLMLVLLDLWLEYSQKNQRTLNWMLVPFFALWANIHGGWIWGFLLLAAYIVGNILNRVTKISEVDNPSGKQLIHLLLWAFVAALAIGINPNGISIWTLPFHTVDVSMQIIEWASPDFHQISFHPLLWMMFLLIASAILGKPKANWFDLLKVVGFAYLTFVSQRNIAPFAIITAPVLANWTNSALEIFRAKLSPAIIKRPTHILNLKIATLINTVILILVGITFIGRACLMSAPSEVNKGMPVNAVQWLRENPSNGHLFNSYNWGGYLTWTLPQTPVFIDGRADLFGKEIIDQWWEVVQGTPRGFSVLEQWQVKTIFIEPDWPIVKLLPEAGWKEAYRDSIAVIFVKEK